MRRFTLLTAAVALVFTLCQPVAAQDTGWSVGAGITAGEASPDGGLDLDLEAFTLFGRWQHASKGWGAMAEIRSGEDDEAFIDLDYDQINLYGTYTWLRDGLARPFIKVGLSNTDVESGGASEDDTALILGGGVEVGRGRWAFHASIDATEPEIGNVDVETTNLTLGAVFRF